MGYGMKYKKGKGFPFKTDLKDLSGTADEPGTKVDLTKKPSIVASKSAKEDYDADNEETNNEETVRINKTPNTRPPMFSDADTHAKIKEHHVSASVTEGSIESQELRRKENKRLEKKN